MAVAQQDPSRVSTRVLRLLLAGVLAATLALPEGPLSGLVSAQEAEETGNGINLINPSGESPALVSDKDMDDHGYHFVAWVREVPPNAVIQFRLVESDIDRVLGNGAQVGSDTFHLHWVIPDGFPAGSYELQAILFSGGQEVARDTMSAEVDQDTAAIRIDYPANGAEWGVYVPPGENQRWAGMLEFTYSEDVRFVDAFYTLTSPGLEPEWISCGSVSGLSGGPEQGRVRCTLAEGHDGRDVTAVKLVPDETPLAPAKAPLRAFEGASDAHRVAPYFQRATEVTVATEGGARTFQPSECTSLFEVFVKDQNGRAIPRVNVDVHATGPDDTGGFSGTRFDVSNQSDPNQAPNDNHPGTTAGWSCAAGAPMGITGNHPNPFGADTRHIESLTSGAGQRTDNDGRFTFRLRSDVTGGTQITAWADLDDDDLYCADEPAGHTSIGWGTAPPAVDGHAPELALGQCPDPEPARPGEEEPSEPIGQPAREFRGRVIGLRPQPLRNRGVARGRVRNTESGRPRCVRNREVRVQRRPLRGGRWNDIRRPRTNRRGVYRTRNRIVRRDGQPRPGRYRAIAVRFVFTTGDGTRVVCRRAISPVRRVPRR